MISVTLKQSQILWVVMQTNAVDMIHNLTSAEITPYFLGKNQSMLKNAAILICHLSMLFRAYHGGISIFVYMTATHIKAIAL